MRARLSLAALAVIASVLFSHQLVPAAQAGRSPGPNTTTLDDQVELAVTVYNSDIALVRDVRNLQLHKYVGRDVTLVRTREEGGATHEEIVKARLLSDNGAPVWRIGGEIVTGLRPDHMRFAELPDNLYTHPTLIWTLDNTGGAKHRVEASYLAGKLSWNADYVLTVSRDDKAADLDGWVTLTNGSGTSFRNAKLQLVAGDLNRVRPQALSGMMEALPRSDVAAAPAMAQEAFSDYHLYTLARKTTINNSETKQVSMLAGTGVPLQKPDGV